MADPAPTPKRRPFWRRLLRWALWSSLLVILIFGGGVWWTYHNRLMLLNRFLEGLSPYHGEVTAINVNLAGDVYLEGLTLRDSETKETLLQLRKLSGNVHWTQIFNRRIESLVLEEPEIIIEDKLIAQWMQKAPPVAGGEPAKPFSLSAALGELDIRKARIRLRQNGKDVAEVTLSHRIKDLSISPDGKFSTGDQEILIEKGAVLQPGADISPIALDKLSASGRIKDGILELDSVAGDNIHIRLTPEWLGLLPAEEGPAGASLEAEPPAPHWKSSPSSTAGLRGVRLKNVSIKSLKAALEGFEGKAVSFKGMQLPNAHVALDYTGENLAWLAESGLSAGAQRITFQDFALQGSDGEGHVRFKKLVASLAPIQPDKRLTIHDIQLEQPDILWTAALREQLLPPAPPTPGTGEAGTTPTDQKNATPAEVEPGKSAYFERLRIEGLRIQIQDPKLMTFHLHARADFALEDFVLDPVAGMSSSKSQSLVLTEGTLAFANGDKNRKPFVELPHGELKITPDKWNAAKSVDRLLLKDPVVRFRDANTPWFNPPLEGPMQNVASITPAAPEDKEEEPTPARATPPWWQQLNFHELHLENGFADILMHAPKALDMQSRVIINTPEPGRHEVRLEEFVSKLPTLSKLPFPVAQAGVIQGTVRLPQMWQEKRIDELNLSGAGVEASDTLMQFFETGAEPEPTKELPADAAAAPDKPEANAPPKKAPDKTPAWSVGKINVEESSVTIANLIPGMPSIKFSLEFHMENAPLSGEGLMRSVTPQRIELTALTIPSPYEPLRPVAELGTVFIHFSMDGLARKEIERVEIISPTLFVGEDLFWYVDYYRKYVSNGFKDPPSGPQMAAVGDDEFTLKAAEVVVTHEPPTSEAAWSVKRFQVHGGKLVLAPKGRRLEGFKQPFPFNIDTEVVRGTMQAQLDIPQDTYVLEQYKLEFTNVRGGVLFNLPLKQRDNNLVETFEADGIRWKDLRTGKAFLSITYDANGIYAKCGAEAYGGYLNGEFNVYLDDSFHWDGWLGAKNMHTKEITDKMLKGSFLMEGQVEATLVAQGSKDELYQADGAFKNNTPGMFSITALNDLLKDLPGDWSKVQKQLTQVGVDALRDFNYDTAEAKCRFYGREGNGFLKFEGPRGVRNFEINVLDHRWTDDKKEEKEGPPPPRPAGEMPDDTPPPTAPTAIVP